MNIAQFLIYAVGLVLVVAALWWIALIAGVFEVVPMSIVLAALVLIVGLGIMGAAFAAKGTTREEHVHHRDDHY